MQRGYPTASALKIVVNFRLKPSRVMRGLLKGPSDKYRFKKLMARQIAVCWRRLDAGVLRNDQLIGGGLVEAMPRNQQTVCQHKDAKH